MRASKPLRRRLLEDSTLSSHTWWDDISESAQNLVSHLLTVDPDKRYDIKQFLAHPWIRGTTEETHAAADAPPLATPLYMRPKEGGQQQAVPQEYYLDIPSAGRRQDFRSPGAVNLREVFDVGYAVHRQEEEGKRRKNFNQGYGNLNALNALDEDDGDEDEEDGAAAPYNASQQTGPPSKIPRSQQAQGEIAADVSSVEQKMRNTTLSAAAQARQAGRTGREPNPQQQRGYGQHSPAVAAAAKRQVKNKGGFELSLDNATLLGRRGKRGDDDGVGEELVVR